MGTVAGTTRKRRSGHYARAAHHAGSWYSDSRSELDQQLSSFLVVAKNEASTNDGQALRGIICPHAGYSYSGPTAAFSYHQLTHELLKEESPITQILILHPSQAVFYKVQHDLLNKRSLVL